MAAQYLLPLILTVGGRTYGFTSIVEAEEQQLCALVHQTYTNQLAIPTSQGFNTPPPSLSFFTSDGSYQRPALLGSNDVT